MGFRTAEPKADRSNGAAANLRAGAAVVAARAAGALSRALGRGGGTALPGVVAERIAPNLLSHLAVQLPNGAFVVTGTNGKTTTSHMLATILRRAGWEPLCNASGSNLWRGIATAMAARAGWQGRLHAAERTVGVFETDEAAFAGVVPAVQPRAVVITNLFRDQLDRYGEVDTVASIWRHALTGQPGTQLILNADDPTVAALGGAAFLSTEPRSGGPLFFGVDDVRWGREGPEHASDAKVCPICGAALAYPVCFYGHLGHYHCLKGHRRPVPAVRAIGVEPQGFAGSHVAAETPVGALRFRLPLPGLYNVYNALAASAAAISFGAPLEAIKEGLEQFSTAFGRLERVDVDGRTLYLVLAKNPVGMNEALRALLLDGEPKHLLMALNDLDADGRDVSWIWDADFERLAGQAVSLTVSGRRAADLALRLKYAGALEGSTHQMASDLAEALDRALGQTPKGGTLYAVVTYSAMLELRKVLTTRGYLRAYWQE